MNHLIRFIYGLLVLMALRVFMEVVFGVIDKAGLILEALSVLLPAFALILVYMLGCIVEGILWKE